jgi:hypothetical protein
VIVALVLVGVVVVLAVVVAGDEVVFGGALVEESAARVAVGCDTARAIPCVLEAPSPPPQATSASGQARLAIRAPRRIAPSSHADLWWS